ncbi:MAG: hypothetical protein NC394_08060 [Bacteroides sp.]|nr:hypothetical protein [Bacteroides sp.]
MEKTLQRIAEAAEGLKSRKKKSGPLPVLVAVDGRCAAGKTTLAQKLAELTGGSVFHTDHFFLRPEQRTEERLRTAGENIDHERFLSEVLLPLKNGEETVRYRPFDCKTGGLSGQVEIKTSGICIIEGSYCCHPMLREYYDLRVFLTVDKGEQLKRIVERNGEKGAEVFKERWIPLEEKYFAEYGFPLSPVSGTTAFWFLEDSREYEAIL